MSENKKNDILEEQRKSRKELLELKKMQQNRVEPIKEQSEPLTKKQAFFNKLYYNKWRIAAVIAAVVAIISFVFQITGKEKNDFGVIIYTHTLVNEQTANAIKEYLEKNCSDVNGDGKVKIAVINCSIDAKSNNYQYNSTIINRLQATLTDSDKLVIINDAETLKEFNSGTATKGMLEGKPLAIGETFKKAKQGDLIFSDNLLVSCRKVKGTVLEKKKNIEKIYKESQKAVNILTN